jgi:riboflavin transporter FmnP
MRRATQIGVLGAIAFTFMSFDFPLPPFPAWLKYDPSEVPALIAAFALGPAAGLAVEAIKGLLMATLRPGGLGGHFGIAMNLLAGMTLVGVAGAYYRLEHTRRGALRAMGLGIAAMTAVMIAANVLLDPIFFGLSRAQVLALVLPALLPFNLLKGLLSSAVTYYVYKRVRVYLYERIADRTVW